MTAPAPSALIDAAALAELLSVSKPTIWRMRESGKLPEPIKLTSQCLRWKRSGPDGIESWIEAGCPDLVTWDSLKGGRNGL
jgi:prophage regulatory protein